jgi:large subunit ribosomal protein L10
MRPEKQFLVEEVGSHLDKSDYVYLTNYDRITVDETADLRSRLIKEGAEFHVVKNSILNIAAKAREYPDLGEHLNGPVAIIVGGDNPSGVAKVLQDFFKEKEKVELKGGVLEDRALTREEIDQLAKLPGMEVLRAQLLGLLNQPASLTVQVLAAVPRSMVQVLQAKATEEGS